ncbi:MAG: penicillin acylase family protein [Undibacterium sp.]|nr:penicillin acylase family protein [Opitutaceae bacterium]
MSSRVANGLRLLASLLSVVVLLAGVAAGWFYFKLRASRPQLDGAAHIAGLAAGVTIERDALGVPTIRGANRLDGARALGWLHAQERFFQMDLQRRRAAGELAELVGASALPLDKETRLHGFRALARTALERATPAERALAEAYAAGVNAGLTALGEKPFEYLMLRTPPSPWRPEDCGLMGFAMTLDLQSGVVAEERLLATLKDTLGGEALAFFAPTAGPRDAALDGSTAPLPAIPSVQAINLRRPQPAPVEVTSFVADRTEVEYPGSNSFALAGAHTANGAGLLANDMHLRLGVPNIWYRAVLVWPEAGVERRVAGVTLPGVPFMIAGSNGRVAWGFTNSHTDASDLIVVQTGISPDIYRAPNREQQPQMEVRHETIAVKGQAPVTMDYRWTIWGPVIGADDKGHPIAQRWVAHEPEALNFGLWAMETVDNTAAALAVAHRAGITPQNILVADTAGEIAWTIAGRLPKRVGYDGRVPSIWTFGDRHWDGLIAPDDIPVVRGNATDGRLWTANNRIVGGAARAALGDGGYDDAMRAAQIRDDLKPLERARPKDLLAVQLDDRALALGRWRDLLLTALAPAATAEKKERAEFRRLVEGWDARASVESVGYRLVRTWRGAVAKRALDPIFATCVEADPTFSWARLSYEEPLWAMLSAKPIHLLSPRETSWETLLVAAVDDVIMSLEKIGTPLARATWGRRNTVKIQHPLARVLPAWLSGWLSMPADELPGDSNMPRVQGVSFGASERFVVSPGHEAEGIFHMPGGQSGHPLSPFYRAGHAAWARGEPTSFLPGKTEHMMTLQP